ncbi:UDP-N-acetyl-D-mannosamine dehydrogenase, partial [Fulvivirga sp. RKSG066]|uniref:UDP binding domain-containing protein n=1 Tax=Fulvivirga aurantia TaxID=2529383 RepID=UPI00248451A2
DLRESPALKVTQTLINDGFYVLPVEPNLNSHSSIDLIPFQEAFTECDLLVYLVNHRDFKDLNLSHKIVLDFCGTKFI